MARANASLTDIEERAPIHLAAERGYTRLVGEFSLRRVLIVAKANAPLTDIEERVPIHLAAERRYTR